MTSDLSQPAADDGGPGRAGHPAELIEAGELVRRLTDALVRVDSGSLVGGQLVVQLQRALNLLDGQLLPDHELIDTHLIARTGSYLDRSPVSGLLNPLAPPIRVHLGEDGLALARARLGMAYQGPPGRVHGGIVAMLLDHVMGYAARTTGGWAFTRSLTVDYDLGVPLFEPLEVLARTESVEGRKQWLAGEVRVAGVARVQARGLWLSPRAEDRET